CFHPPPYHHTLHPRTLHSFPTRRSSDLARNTCSAAPSSTNIGDQLSRAASWCRSPVRSTTTEVRPTRLQRHRSNIRLTTETNPRSEEHTSELQSPDHLVCRLLLEKKKKQ